MGTKFNVAIARRNWAEYIGMRILGCTDSRNTEGQSSVAGVAGGIGATTEYSGSAELVDDGWRFMMSAETVARLCL
ncbi:hypothetical protein W02_35830 [Nitrospira sp. KM1]|nr:hypothetical protein W02_35830 [Nitrospira sp. KM1]